MVDGETFVSERWGVQGGGKGWRMGSTEREEEDPSQQMQRKYNGVSGGKSTIVNLHANNVTMVNI